MNANDQVTSLLESSTLVLKAGSVDPSGAPEAQQGDSVIYIYIKKKTLQRWKSNPLDLISFHRFMGPSIKLNS